MEVKTALGANCLSRLASSGAMHSTLLEPEPIDPQLPPFVTHAPTGAEAALMSTLFGLALHAGGDVCHEETWLANGWVCAHMNLSVFLFFMLSASHVRSCHRATR